MSDSEQDRMVRGALLDEMESKALAYRRALNRHAEALADELVALSADRYAMADHRHTGALALSWRRVRECRDVLDAAIAAVRQDSKNR